MEWLNKDGSAILFEENLLREARSGKHTNEDGEGRVLEMLLGELIEHRLSLDGDRRTEVVAAVHEVVQLEGQDVRHVAEQESPLQDKCVAKTRISC